MNKLLLTRRVSRMLLGILVVVFGLTTYVEAQAQCDVIIPQLNLTGDLSGYNTAWYPDGRIWIPPSSTSKREFLLPVFIEVTDQTFAPIKSFEFSISYNGNVFKAVGIQTHHPVTAQEAQARNDNRFLPYVEPLAKNFNFQTFDLPDNNYTINLFPTRQPTDPIPSAGRKFKIVGASTTPLPATNVDNRKYNVLLYVVFEVLVDKENPNLPVNTPIYINADVIKYNGINIREHVFTVNNFPCVPKSLAFTDDEGTITNQSPITGLTGMRNDNLPAAVIDWQTYPERYIPGSIWVTIFEKIPEFRFMPGPGIVQSTSPTSSDSVMKISEGYWKIYTPLTVDNADIQPRRAQRIVRVRIPDALSKTRIQDIVVESDKPWLNFQTVTVGTISKNPIPQLTRKGFINYIDFGILGSQDFKDPKGQPIGPDGEIFLLVDCDPSKLTTSPFDNEKEGLYTGHITFTTPYIDENPTKLEVNFILFKAPVEPIVKTNIVPGIKLTVSNNKGESKLLIFGTGTRASDDIDTLYGECPYEWQLGQDPQGNTIFDARWFPVNSVLAAKYPNGFWDFAANEAERRSNSRDIRDFNYTAKSHIFYCKFEPNNSYPITVTWDTSDFYPGAQLYIHDMQNGLYFPAVNMREATPLSDGKFSFTILDPRVREFVIEYTLPTVVDYINKAGEPIIKKGWNLLSMPVRPVNPYYANFYKNAINIPILFTQNQYQTPPDGILQPGIGYFVKYDSIVDTKFPGTFIYDLDKNVAPFNGIRLYTGWNTIGSVSVPLGIDHIRFDALNAGQDAPDVTFTRQYGVWAYETNKGYKEVSEILPGLGYWIKVNTTGYLKVNVPQNLRLGFKLNSTEVASVKKSVLNNAAVLSIKDSDNNNGTLYLSNDLAISGNPFELPPAPIAEMFDVRFADNSYLTTENEGVVRVQGVKYPLTVSIENAKDAYKVVDVVTGEVFGEINRFNNSITINRATYNAFKLVKTDATLNASLSVNPNPVSSTATVNFAIPMNANVTISLFDALGNEVATLLNSSLNAGNHSYTFDASRFATGNYIVKIVAGDRTEVAKINIVR
ncbi:MAG TPA: T9SS type A sorting domain-containing protein [Candidatus Kapabacteria bacterium]|nr:T9SS type A sorting domain-containing protein [Candidatus Kapabacteria bacterium]